jgi:hypothetical protein
LDARGEGIAAAVDDPGELLGESLGSGVREFKVLHDREMGLRHDHFSLTPLPPLRVSPTSRKITPAASIAAWIIASDRAATIGTSGAASAR